jgi:hypothetical protein
MKLIRFGAAGKEKPGVLVGEKRYRQLFQIIMKLFLKKMV